MSPILEIRQKTNSLPHRFDYGGYAACGKYFVERYDLHLA